MNKKNLGFALLLMGIIFAAPADTLFWYIGLVLGIIGLLLVATSKSE